MNDFASSDTSLKAEMLKLGSSVKIAFQTWKSSGMLNSIRYKHFRVHAGSNTSRY